MIKDRHYVLINSELEEKKFFIKKKISFSLIGFCVKLIKLSPYLHRPLPIHSHSLDENKNEKLLRSKETTQLKWNYKIFPTKGN